MRITFILPPVNFSGGVKVIAIYVRQLRQMGHIVRIISLPPKEIAFSQKLKSWVKGNGWPNDLISRKSHLDEVVDLDHRVIDRWRPVTDHDVPDGDVVIATWWETAEWVQTLSSCKGAKAYLIQGHEIFVPMMAARVRATYHMPLHKIVIAEWLKQVMNEQYGDHCVDVVPNSVDRTQFFASVRGKQPVPTVGFLHSAAHVKGLDLALEALQIVRKRLPELRLVSFGHERPSSQLPLAKRMEFFHLPPQNEIRNLYARCDAWITASRSEGFNLPALEAMACRTPVVSTRTGWPAEAIKSGWNGVLVDVDNVLGLAQGVEWILLRSDQEWRNLSANAHETALAGSWNQSAKLLERALEHACQRTARRELVAASPG